MPPWAFKSIPGQVAVGGPRVSGAWYLQQQELNFHLLGATKGNSNIPWYSFVRRFLAFDEGALMDLDVKFHLNYTFAFMLIQTYVYCRAREAS